MERFGIEIEAYGLFRGDPADEQTLYPAQETIALHASGIGNKHWRAVPDRSVAPDDGTMGFEVVSVPLRWDVGIDEAIRATACLAMAGAKVNGSCGLHVHVEMPDSRSEAAKLMHRAYETYQYFENAFDSFMHPDRREDINQYCKSIREVRFGALKDRYHKVNPFSYVHHGTLEFRHHHATLDQEVLGEWLRTVKRFMEKVTNLPPDGVAGVYTPDHAGLASLLDREPYSA